MINIKNRLFPQFVQEKSPKIIEFFGLYIDWLHLEGNSGYIIDHLTTENDIDESIDSFKDGIKNKLLVDFPDTMVCDLKLILKNIMYLYKSKSSIKSYNFIFEVLFGVPCDLRYSKNFLLRVDDGRFNLSEYLSLNVDYFYDNFANWINARILTINEEGIIDKGAYLLRPSFIDYYDGKGKQKAFLIDTTDNNFSANDEIYIQDTKTEILYAGYITQKDSKGNSIPNSVKKLLTYDECIEILTYNAIIKELQNQKAKGEYYGVIDKEKEINFFYITNYAKSDISFNTISEEIKTGKYIYDTETGIDKEESVLRYHTIPSTENWKGTFGLLDSDMVLQNGKEYQEFSYWIHTYKNVNDWKKIILSLIHPSGLGLFAKYNISDGDDIPQYSITDYEADEYLNQELLEELKKIYLAICQYVLNVGDSYAITKFNRNIFVIAQTRSETIDRWIYFGQNFNSSGWSNLPIKDTISFSNSTSTLLFRDDGTLIHPDLVNWTDYTFNRDINSDNYQTKSIYGITLHPYRKHYLNGNIQGTQYIPYLDEPFTKRDDTKIYKYDNVTFQIRKTKDIVTNIDGEYVHFNAYESFNISTNHSEKEPYSNDSLGLENSYDDNHNLIRNKARYESFIGLDTEILKYPDKEPDIIKDAYLTFTTNKNENITHKIWYMSKNNDYYQWDSETATWILATIADTTLEDEAERIPIQSSRYFKKKWRELSVDDFISTPSPIKKVYNDYSFLKYPEDRIKVDENTYTYNLIDSMFIESEEILIYPYDKDDFYGRIYIERYNSDVTLEYTINTNLLDRMNKNTNFINNNSLSKVGETIVEHRNDYSETYCNRYRCINDANITNFKIVIPYINITRNDVLVYVDGLLTEEYEFEEDDCSIGSTEYYSGKIIKVNILSNTTEIDKEKTDYKKFYLSALTYESSVSVNLGNNAVFGSLSLSDLLLVSEKESKELGYLSLNDIGYNIDGIQLSSSMNKIEVYILSPIDFMRKQKEEYCNDLSFIYNKATMNPFIPSIMSLKDWYIIQHEIDYKDIRKFNTLTENLLLKLKEIDYKPLSNTITNHFLLTLEKNTAILKNKIYSCNSVDTSKTDIILQLRRIKEFLLHNTNISFSENDNIIHNNEAIKMYDILDILIQDGNIPILTFIKNKEESISIFSKKNASESSDSRPDKWNIYFDDTKLFEVESHFNRYDTLLFNDSGELIDPRKINWWNLQFTEYQNTKTLTCLPLYGYYPNIGGTLQKEEGVVRFKIESANMNDLIYTLSTKKSVFLIKNKTIQLYNSGDYVTETKYYFDGEYKDGKFILNSTDTYYDESTYDDILFEDILIGNDTIINEDRDTDIIENLNSLDYYYNIEGLNNTTVKYKFEMNYEDFFTKDSHHNLLHHTLIFVDGKKVLNRDYSIVNTSLYLLNPENYIKDKGEIVICNFDDTYVTDFFFVKNTNQIPLTDDNRPDNTDINDKIITYEYKNLTKIKENIKSKLLTKKHILIFTDGLCNRNFKIMNDTILLDNTYSKIEVYILNTVSPLWIEETYHNPNQLNFIVKNIHHYTLSAIEDVI